MLTASLSRGLAEYGIGGKLRALRLRRKLGLVELGRHTGLSPALLSKLERGRMFPTLPTLLRIALVYGVGLDHFFSASEPRRAVGVVRAAERRTFSEKLGGREVAWEFECLDYAATARVLNAYKVRFLRTSPRPRLHDHAGAEFVHVLSGALGLVVSGEAHELSAGDSIYFDASQPHGYQRLSARPAEAIVVTVPDPRP
jgi:transcriptional regulator with XRE-family HTH domain